VLASEARIYRRSIVKVPARRPRERPGRVRGRAIQRQLDAYIDSIEAADTALELEAMIGLFARAARLATRAAGLRGFSQW
jgi:hypothetical protein